MANRRYAKKVARVVARKSYRSARRMPKRRLVKVYANKMGKVTYKAVVSKKRRYGRRFRRFSRRYKRRRY